MEPVSPAAQGKAPQKPEQDFPSPQEQRTGAKMISIPVLLSRKSSKPSGGGSIPSPYPSMLPLYEAQQKEQEA